MLVRHVACGVMMVLFSLHLSCNAETTTNGNQEEKSVTIPLDQIWAWRMPGTRDIGTLEPNKPPNYAYGPLLGEILRSLADSRPENEEAKSGFAVRGTGMEALRHVHAVLVKGQKPSKAVSAGNEISLIIYSHQFGPYVHLDHVERDGSIFRIYYRFVPHETEEVTEHLALISVGRLPTGKITVDIVRLPMEKKFSQWGFKPVSKADEFRTICKSFRFLVKQPSSTE